MQRLASIAKMRAASAAVHRAGQRLGFVPTMGALHDGHLSLVREAKAQADVTVVSIFVNPLQFPPGEDYHRYPRQLSRDLAQLEALQVDYVFTPSVEEMYPQNFLAYVNVERLSAPLCGQFRPDHFRGVTTIVLKLFAIIQPDLAFFGRKDAQQCVIIRQMVRDLNLPVEIVVCPIVRAPDGLALSSRNRYLSPEERQAAVIIFRSLCHARDLIRVGERRAAEIINRMRELLAQEPRARPEYIEIVDADQLTPKNRIAGRTLIALAVWLGPARLIDNLLVEERAGRFHSDL